MFLDFLVRTLKGPGMAPPAPKAAPSATLDEGGKVMVPMDRRSLLVTLHVGIAPCDKAAPVGPVVASGVMGSWEVERALRGYIDKKAPGGEVSLTAVTSFDAREIFLRFVNADGDCVFHAPVGLSQDYVVAGQEISITTKCIYGGLAVQTGVQSSP